MSLIGFSTLELRQLIEQAFLPEHCEVSCLDGKWLTIRLGKENHLIVSEVLLESLTTCHEVHALVDRIREDLRLNRPPGDPWPRTIV